MSNKKRNNNQQGPRLLKRIQPKTDGQFEYMRAITENDITICTGPAGSGKAQPFGSIIYTPNGPVKIENITVGDIVCTPHHQTAKVVGVYPQGIKEVFEVTFSDGSTTRCCKEHLWTIESRNNFQGQKTFTLEQIQNYGLYTKSGKRKIRLPQHGQIYFHEQQLPIHPYVLGCLLGDGSFRNSITFTNFDEEIIHHIENKIKDGCVLSHTKLGKYCLKNKEKNSKPNYYKETIKDLGLFNKLSTEKFIPNIYLYNSVENRLELLRGLLDTDGFISNTNSNIEYYTSSKQLCDNFKTLVQSLGGIVTIVERIPYYVYNGIKKAGQLSYRLTVKLDIHHLFNLSRKQNRVIDRTKYFPTRFMTNIKSVGYLPCVCIKIDSDEQLYLTDEFIVTHNTLLASSIAAEKLLNREYDKIIITRPVIGCGKKSLGALPGDIDEKMAPYLAPIFQHFSTLIGEQLLKTYIGEKRIQISPLEFMRGSNFDDCFVILDEAQNADFDELVMFITRFSEGCKMVINGDPAQTDLYPGARGIDTVIKQCRNIHGFGVVELTTNDIVRHDIVRRFLIAMEPIISNREYRKQCAE